MMLMARVCEGNGDGDVYDDSGGYGDDYYSGELKEACLNCVVGAIVIKDADDILNNFFTSLVLAFSKHLLLLAISCIYSGELFGWSVLSQLRIFDACSILFLKGVSMTDNLFIKKHLKHGKEVPLVMLLIFS